MLAKGMQRGMCIEQLLSDTFLLMVVAHLVLLHIFWLHMLAALFLL